MAATALHLYFWFRCCYFAQLRRSKSTCRPNFGDISRSMEEIAITTSGLWKQTLTAVGRHVGILLPVLIFTFVSSSACHSATACQISSKADHPQHSYDVISVFQDGGHGIAILLSGSFFVSSLIWESRNLTADQISARYLNPWLRDYYFRFRKTNVCHVGILFPVSIFTFVSSSASNSASAYQISSKSDRPRGVMTS